MGSILARMTLFALKIPMVGAELSKLRTVALRVERKSLIPPCYMKCRMDRCVGKSQGFRK